MEAMGEERRRSAWYSPCQTALLPFCDLATRPCRPVEAARGLVRWVWRDYRNLAVRPLVMIVLVVVPAALLAHASSAATRPGAVVTTRNGTTHVLKGAHCIDGRLYFGAPINRKGKSLGLVLGPFRLGRTAVIAFAFVPMIPRWGCRGVPTSTRTERADASTSGRASGRDSPAPATPVRGVARSRASPPPQRRDPHRL